MTRTSVYVVARDSANRVAAVRAPQGLFLPGGGVERGESVLAAAIRESAEEAGLHIRVTAEIGAADECVVLEEEPFGHLVKASTFFRASILGRGQATEPDHELVWLDHSEAEASLTYESHRWAVIRDSGRAD